MGLEAATVVSEFDPLNPTGGDPRSQGDNHIRMMKQALQNTLQNARVPISLPVVVQGTTGALQINVLDLGAQNELRWDVDTVGLPGIVLVVEGAQTPIQADQVGNWHLITFLSSGLVTNHPNMQTGLGTDMIIPAGSIALFESIAVDAWRVVAVFTPGVPATYEANGFWRAGQIAVPVDVSIFAGVATLNADDANVFRLSTMTSNFTLEVTGINDGQNIEVILKQDAVGGWAITYDSIWKFPEGDSGQPNTDANSTSLLCGVYNHASGKILAAMTRYT